MSKPPETERQRSVIFDLRYQGAKDMEFNQDRIDKRREKLKKAGGFRTLVRRGVLNRRVYNTVWSDKIHMLRDFDETGAFARDTDDHLFPTKDVLPVDVPGAAQEQGEAPVEQEAVDEPQPPTPMSRPSSAAAAPSDRRREMIRRWKAFCERGLPAGVRAAGVEQMRPSDNELRQARRDLAENAERIARKGPTQPRLDLQRSIEARIAELEKPCFQIQGAAT